MAAGPLKDGDEDDVMSDINVVPLVDIVLVLLIIFMVTTSQIVHRAIEVDLPEAAHGGEVVDTTLSLVLDPEGALWLNGERVRLADLATRVPQMKAEAERGGGSLQAIIAADRGIAHGEVVRLIDTIKGLGVTRFAINIERISEEEAAAAVEAGG
jgi:biopolymer transport protein TolR